MTQYQKSYDSYTTERQWCQYAKMTCPQKIGKRDGAVKARGCADGRPQQQYTEKGDASSLTVSLEAMMMSCCIDTKEGQYVAVADIPGAFLHANMNKCVHMIMEGTIAKHIAKLEPKIYRKYIWYDKKGKPMLYVKLKKALHGTLQAALLFWQLLSSTLIEWGFAINPYDQCMANKQIHRKQCTIIWHVDDLKISHVEEKVIEDIIRRLKECFGKESPLTTSRVKVLEYLGLTLDYSIWGRVKISMYKYVKKLVEEAPEDMTGVTKTPAGNHLFTTNPDCDKLSEKMVQVFHHIVAKLLYLCK